MDLDSRIAKIVNEKLRFYKAVTIAFVAGLTICISALIANQVLSRQGLLSYVINNIIDYKNNPPLRSVINSTTKSLITEYTYTAYVDQFNIGGKDNSLPKAHSVLFYAKKGQSVDATINLAHYGIGDLYNYAITLDNISASECCLPQTNKVLQDEQFNLQNYVAESYNSAQVPKNDLHFLNIFIASSDLSKLRDDIIIVKVMIKVTGIGTDEVTEN